MIENLIVIKSFGNMSLVFIFTRRTKIHCICVCSYFSDVPVREKFSIKSHKPFSFFLSTSGRFKILSAMQTPTYIIAKEKQKKVFVFVGLERRVCNQRSICHEKSA
jgi:hypothetical protein